MDVFVGVNMKPYGENMSLFLGYVIGAARGVYHISGDRQRLKQRFVYLKKRNRKETAVFQRDSREKIDRWVIRGIDRFENM